MKPLTQLQLGRSRETAERRRKGKPVRIMVLLQLGRSRETAERSLLTLVWTLS